MKIVIIGDLHFDIKDGSYNAWKYQRRFFDEVLFPVLDRGEIDIIVQTGDVFHNRRNINLRILGEVTNLFAEINSRYKKVSLYGILGNHDYYFRNSYETSTVKDIKLGFQYGESRYSIISPEVVCIHWHNTTEELFQTFVEICQHIDSTKVQYIIGHFSLWGFNFNSKIINTNTQDASSTVFKQYFPNLKRVFSGHFHSPSEDSLVKYVGVPYHLTWGEVSDVLGFHVLDTKDGSLEFIQNPFRAFEIVRIGDLKEDSFESYDINADKPTYRKCYKIFFQGEKQEVAARQFYEYVLQSGHDAILVDETVYQEEEISNSIIPDDSSITIETLIERYFLQESRIIPQEERQMYYDIFKNLYDEIKTQVETVEI